MAKATTIRKIDFQHADRQPLNHWRPSDSRNLVVKVHSAPFQTDSLFVLSDCLYVVTSHKLANSCVQNYIELIPIVRPLRFFYALWYS